MMENHSITEPLAYGVHGAAQKRERWPGVIQNSKPPPEGGGIGYAIGIFDRRSGVFQRTVFQEVALESLTAGDQAVVGVWEGERRQEGERDAARFTDAPANLNPNMVFVMGLFRASAMADDGIL